MKAGLIYDVEQDAIDKERVYFKAIKAKIEELEVDQDIEKYAPIRKHPSKDLWFVQLSFSGYYGPSILAATTQQEMDSIEELTEDWIENP